jgi:DNA (cytosine-5)-methyltransferase 1
MNFPWQWRQADGYPAPGVTKHGATVFSTFACGGGSSMGYKLAGYEVLGYNEVDPKMAKIYDQNHNPPLRYLCPIQDMVKRDDLDPRLFDLDVLDGSPPCTVFSMSGKRADDWGVKRKYKEGEFVQTLDDLFFHFINLAEKLKPKVCITENVKGMLLGDAKGYLLEVRDRFSVIGYDTQLFLVNGSRMGVPQKRERVFFLSRRRDLELPPAALEFNQAPIPFGEVRTSSGGTVTEQAGMLLKHRRPQDKNIGDINERMKGKVSRFNAMIVDDHAVCPTITAGEMNYRGADNASFSDLDYIRCSTFPEDFDFTGSPVKYVCGMSVPPVMMAHVAAAVWDQWLAPLRARA